MCEARPSPATSLLQTRRRWRAAPLAAVLAAATAAHAQQLDLQLFSSMNVGLEASADGAWTSSFVLPNVVFFATATADRWTFLTEVVAEYSQHNLLAVDVERIEIGYLAANWLRVRAGRFHSAIGFYSDTYHHGAYHMLTLSRPLASHFEDDGGIIPAHAIGLHVDGRVELGTVGSARYDLELSNGRGLWPADITTIVDPNNSKMVNLRLRWEPRFLDGLVLGGNVALDWLASNPDTGAPRLTERLLGAHAAYVTFPFHLVGELNHLRHVAEVSGQAWDTWSISGEAGYAMSPAVTPYARYERTSRPSTPDPFFGDVGPSLHQVLAGAKWLVGEHVAFKLEGALRFPDGAAPSGSVRVEVSSAF